LPGCHKRTYTCPSSQGRRRALLAYTKQQLKVLHESNNGQHKRRSAKWCKEQAAVGVAVAAGLAVATGDATAGAGATAGTPTGGGGGEWLPINPTFEAYQGWQWT